VSNTLKPSPAAQTSIHPTAHPPSEDNPIIHYHPPKNRKTKTNRKWQLKSVEERQEGYHAIRGRPKPGMKGNEIRNCAVCLPLAQPSNTTPNSHSLSHPSIHNQGIKQTTSQLFIPYIKRSTERDEKTKTLSQIASIRFD
jgi:hypothetical protein